MCLVVCVAVVLGMVAGVAGQVSAAPAAATVDALDSSDVTDDRSVALQAIIADVDARTEAARDPVERSFLSQIAGHYREYDARPLWTGAGGLTAEGGALYEELAKADIYGLDPSQFQLPAVSLIQGSVAERASAEVDLSVSAVRYAWHARGGRVVGSQLSRWIDATPRSIYASDVFRAVAADPVAGLRSFHPRHPQFERLRQAYLEARGDVEPASLPRLEPGERIDAGKRHPDVVLIRQRLGVPATDAEAADRLDRGLVRRIRSYLEEAGYEPKRFVDDEVREAINRAPPPARVAKRATLVKFLVNMERWRTMPEDMGALHVWNNLPEYKTRVIKNGEVVFEERIIIGKPNTQTPVFSDTIDHVIFQPEWGVPESIKLRQILPHMRGGDYGVLARRGMSIRDGKRVINPARINWAKVNVRDVPIIQGSGPGNPLGRLKFMFPNHHDVYMHDTNDKHLFKSSARTFSHGCIRVRRPERFAEVLLGEIEGWSPADVARQLKVKSTARIDLRDHIPVHNTYLTTWVNPDGTVVQFTDIYGHDKRYSEALAGKSVKLIASRDPALALKRQNDELRRNVAAVVRPKPRVDLAGLPPGQQGPWFKWGLGKPVKKYTSPAPPPRLLWFQEY